MIGVHVRSTSLLPFPFFISKFEVSHDAPFLRSSFFASNIFCKNHLPEYSSLYFFSRAKCDLHVRIILHGENTKFHAYFYIQFFFFLVCILNSRILENIRTLEKQSMDVKNF